MISAANVQNISVIKKRTYSFVFFVKGFVSLVLNVFYRKVHKEKAQSSQVENFISMDRSK
jgi:hypothetical protein